MHSKHDTHDDGKDDHLRTGLDIKGDVRQPTPLYRVGMVVFIARYSSRGVGIGFCFHFGRIARQTRECCRPEGQRRLIGDQADDVQSDANVPFVCRMDAEPAEPDCICDY